MPDYGDNTGGRYEYQGQLDPNAPSVLNGRITPAQWAQYQARRRRDAILGMLGVAGATTGLGFLGQALSGAGAAGSAAAGGGAGAAGGGAGALPPIAGGAPWAITPYAGSATAAGTGAAGAAAGAGGAGAGLFAGLSTRDLIGLGLAGAGAVGGALSNQPDFSPNTMTNDPNLQRLLQTMQGRLDKSEPLYDSIMAMANGLLPTRYQKGGGGMP